MIAGRRDEIFLVSKIWPTHAASEASIKAALRASLKRLGTDHFDLYLLHASGNADLKTVVTTFEQLRSGGGGGDPIVVGDVLHHGGARVAAAAGTRVVMVARGEADLALVQARIRNGGGQATNVGHVAFSRSYLKRQHHCERWEA